MSSRSGAKRSYKNFVDDYRETYSTLLLELCRSKKLEDRETLRIQLRELWDEYVSGLKRETKNLIEARNKDENPGIRSNRLTL